MRKRFLARGGGGGKREREKDGERRRSTLRRVPGWSRLPFEWFMDGLLLLVYSPLFKTITYCGERSDSLPSTFKTMILVIFSLSFLSFWRGEKKNLLEKREEKPIFRSLSSRRFLSRQFASSKTARRDKKEWVWKRGEWLVESFLPAMRCVTEGIGRRRKRLAEGCFELRRIVWRQKNDRPSTEEETRASSFSPENF